MINSRLGLFTATTSRWHPFFRSYGVNMPSSLTTLLPLALGSSPHLPVSVCGTGAFCVPHTFSRCRFIGLPYYNFSPFRPGRPTPGFRLFNMSVCLNFGGYGFSTVCASTTPSGLALAPGLPVADEPTHGNLRFSAITILTQFSLLIPAFSLECSPHVLPVMLPPAFDAPLPIPQDSQASVICFSPVESSAQHHSTSELLRTL